jgi:hypothetical protein
MASPDNVTSYKFLLDFDFLRRPTEASHFPVFAPQIVSNSND